MRRRRSAQPKLITIAISLYNELARWSLESCGIAYRERRCAIGIHAIASRIARGAGTTPTLLAGNVVLSDSATIAEWADAEARRRGEGRGIYPTDASTREQAERLVAHLTVDLGLPARRLPWQYLVDDPKLTARYWSVGLPSWQARLQPLLLRAIKAPTRRAIGLSPEQLVAVPGQIEAAFDLIAGMLGDGRPFLLGEEFGIADICFAAMASPAVCPTDGHPVPHYQPEDLPHEIAEQIRGFRAHPAGEYALRIYREYRQP
jgi:glutathione S-transferase